MNGREKNNRGGRRIHRAFCESATSEDDTHGKKQPMCAPPGGRIRDSKVGAPGVYFFEKQSHQVIENTNVRPKFGQNNPKFGHLAGWGGFESDGGLFKPTEAWFWRSERWAE